jgi:MinD superfamily P-loop ATPase
MQRFWNSESRFVVTGAKEFSISTQKDILDFFSRLGIYNCIIVNQEKYEIDKEYSRQVKVNNVDTGLKLEVCTWFP